MKRRSQKTYTTQSNVGTIAIGPLDPAQHLGLVHQWVTEPRAKFWDMQDATIDDVVAEYLPIIKSDHHDAWIGTVDGQPAFLVETYDPAQSPLADLYRGEPRDVGMHVLIAGGAEPVHGYTDAVFDAVMKFCFDDSDTQRVVVEPDVRNAAIRRKNVAAGFVELNEITLPTKTAMLSVCRRADFRPLPQADPHSGDPVAHLNPDSLSRAQRHLVAKALGELAHERLLVPIELEPGRYELITKNVRYTFAARRYQLEHWQVDPDSIECYVDGGRVDCDVQHLISDLADDLGVPADLLPFYLEELAATIAGAAWKDAHRRVSALELLDADLATTEAAMTEGHPAFIANNGRIGYSLRDYVAYAPESGSQVTLVWLAVRRTKANLSLGAGLSEQELYDFELDAVTRDGFDSRLSQLGLDSSDYLLMPLHPWQWEHKVAVTFAPDLARHDLVYLGTGPDRYAAQQSVRTFLNLDRPERHYVKTALSVQNMGFMRGLSPAYMRATPAINDWVSALVAGDSELRDRGFTVLRERAAIGYTGDAYHRTEQSSAHQKMLAALWRESASSRLADGERAATMASLLHRDADGNWLVAELIAASGLQPSDWLRRFADAYLVPVVHCLVAHELVFMPHGENLIIVFADHVPVRAIMKDVGEEVAIFNDQPLPGDVERIRMSMPDDHKVLAVLTDAVDGFLRFLAAALDASGTLDEAAFWRVMAAAIVEHRERHPELAEASERIDVLAEQFAHSCLNRLQLRNTKQMVNIADQAESLMFAGTLSNPLAQAYATV